MKIPKSKTPKKKTPKRKAKKVTVIIPVKKPKANKKRKKATNKKAY